MKKVLIGLLLLTGCAGNWNGNPYGAQSKDHSIVTKQRAIVQPWWQADTAGITSNSPWEKFVKKNKKAAPPKLFPDDWKPAKDETRKLLKENKELRRRFKNLKRLLKALKETHYSKPI